MTNLNHKEMTAHIRKRVKAAKLPARVKMATACGVKYIQIVMNKDLFEGEREWTADQAKEIALIAQCNRLTGARGSDINLNINKQLTEAWQFDFEFHGAD